MLTIKNLHADYGKVQVLHGISIDVPKSKVVTLIGSNDAGKTTTMRAVCGMIRPTDGEISLNGKRIDGLEPYHIAKLGLAHSPEGRRVFATMSVTDNLTLVRRSDVILLAVKPQILGAVLDEIAPATPGKLLISVAAGVSTSEIRRHLPPGTRMIRVMPNTPALVLEGATAIA